MKSLKSIFNLHLAAVCVISMLLLMGGCDEELPTEGSKKDETPPSAFFTYSQSSVNYLDVSFTNESVSATDYVWDFGDGNSSTEKEPSNVYESEGTYEVSLTATDKLGAESTYTETIELVEPDEDFTPVILEPGFEDNSDGSDLCGDGQDGRDCWRNSDLGGVIQITSSPVHAGSQGAKLPTSNDRIGYQLITVEANTDYTVSFYYTMKETPAGSLTVSILDGPVSDPSQIEGATIASTTVNDQTDANTFILESVSFNSGSSTEIAIYFYNIDVESRLDSFTIVEN